MPSPGFVDGRAVLVLAHAGNESLRTKTTVKVQNMTVRWGMLSTAAIGRVVAGAIRGSTQAEFVAVAGRDPNRAAAYAAELGVPRSVGSYHALLADDGVDAVYLPLPIALHTE